MDEDVTDQTARNASLPWSLPLKARYERRSLLVTANQPFGDWGKVFPDQAMTLAAIDTTPRSSR